MAQGRVKTLVDRGFGFIASDSGDVFFHMSVVEGTTFELLQEGQEVEYETESGPKGPRATFVRLSDTGAPAMEAAPEPAPMIAEAPAPVDDGGNDAGDGDDGGDDAGDGDDAGGGDAGGGDAGAGDDAGGGDDGGDDAGDGDDDNVSVPFGAEPVE